LRIARRVVCLALSRRSDESTIGHPIDSQ